MPRLGISGGAVLREKAANTGVKLRSSIMLGFVSFNSLFGGLVRLPDQ
jgi:hypothetical protein